MELTFVIFLFFIQSSNAFVAWDLFWTKCLILHARKPVMLNHKIWWASQKEALCLGQKLGKYLLNFTYDYQDNAAVWTFDDNIDNIFSGQEPHTSNSNHLFWNLEDSVVVQTLSCRRKITYRPLLIGFSHKLISMQDVQHFISNFMHQWVIYQLKRCSAEQAIFVLQWSNKIS